MNGFRFFKTKSNPVFHFKIHIQIQKQTISKSKSGLNPNSYYFHISLHLIQLNMLREKIYIIIQINLCSTLFYNTIIVETSKTST